MNIKKDIFSVLFLLALVLIFFHKALPFNHQLITGNDLVTQFHYAKFTLDEILINHALPLWNPYLLCGITHVPWLVMYIGYPLNYLFFFLPLYTAFNYIFILHFLLAGISMYFLGQTLKLDRHSSLIAAVVFTFCGFLVTHAWVGHLGMVIALCWLPLIFLLFEKLLKKKTFILALFLGGAIGLQMLGGYLGAIQYTMYTYGVLVLYLLFRFKGLLKETGGKGVRRIVFLFLLATVIGFSLAALYFLPNYEISSLSARSWGSNYKFATSGSFLPQNLITFILPDFFGNPLYHNSYWGEWMYHELATYVGILPLILALLAIYLLFKKNGRVCFLTILGFIALILALGRNTPFYKLLYYGVPLFDKFRCPSRFLILFQFSLALLAGFGFRALTDEISERDKERLSRFSQGLMIVCICLLLLLLFLRLGREPLLSFGKSMIDKKAPLRHHTLNYYYEQMHNGYPVMLRNLYFSVSFFIMSTFLIILRQKERIKLKGLKTLVLCLILCDLGIFGMRFFARPVDVDQWLSENEALIFLKQDKGLYRIFPLPEIDERIFLNMGEIHRIQSIHGASTSITRRYTEFRNVMEGRPVSAFRPWAVLPTENYNSRLANLLNMKYLLSTKEIGSNRFDLVFNKDIKIYRNKEFIPRAFLVNQVKVIKDRNRIFKELNDSNFEFRQCVILEEDPGVKLSGSLSKLRKSEAEIIHWSPNKIEIETTSPQNTFLVLSEIYYPGWKVYVDAKERKIYQADYILRAVYLESGKHTIRFVYDPLSFKAGLCISLITFLFLCGAIGYRLHYHYIGK